MLLGMKGFISAVFVSAMIAAPLLAQPSTDDVTPDVQRLYAEAKTAEQQDDSSTAIAKYRTILRISPDLAPAYNNLGMLYFKRHDYPQAVLVLEQGLKIKEDMPTAIAMLGLSYSELGDDRKAEPLLRHALRADAGNEDVKLSLAHVLLALGKNPGSSPTVE